MADLYFVTFGNQRFTDRRWALAEEIRSSGRFKNIFVYGDNDLSSFDRKLTGAGGGWWWWKPIIQSFAFSQMNEGDILLYLDAGCYFNKLGVKTFDHYLSLLENNSGFLGFTTGDHDTTERTYTKLDVFEYLDCNSHQFTDTKQIASGLFLLRKNNLSTKLMELFVAASENIHLFDDSPSTQSESNRFVSHKNDQSVFSLLVKKVYQLHKIDLLVLDHLYIDGIKYNHSDEVEIVRNALKNKQYNDEALQSLKFPIITARIDDNL